MSPSTHGKSRPPQRQQRQQLAVGLKMNRDRLVAVVKQLKDNTGHYRRKSTAGNKDYMEEQNGSNEKLVSTASTYIARVALT